MFCFLDTTCILAASLIGLLDGFAITGFVAATDEPSMVASFLTTTWLGIKVALGIGLVIFVHELGHFLAAKTFGVKCEKFYVGFDPPISIGPIKLPRTLGKFQYGETEYGIGIIPLGGYVKMLGQDDDPRRAEEEAQRIRTGDETADGEVELDPRSYPAKKVWQRMIIISAGVVVNVITGVMFAAIAYFYGVPYTPAVVGGVAPGGSAWQAGVQPGGQVVAVADLETNPNLHFNKMREAITLAGMDMPGESIDVNIAYDGDETRQYQLIPQSHPLESSLRMIGIYGPNSTRLPDGDMLMPGSSAATALKDIEAGSRVVAFDSTELGDDELTAINPFLDRLYSAPDQPIDVTLASQDDTRRTVTLAPQMEKHFGVRFRPGPITVLVKDGAAEKAGVKVGDEIVAVNGNKQVDMYDLVTHYSDPSEEIELTVKRGQGSKATEETIRFQPDDVMQTASPVSKLGEVMGNRALGIAFKPTTSVSQVLADSTEIQAGDEIAEVQVEIADSAAKAKLEKLLGEPYVKTLTEGWEISPSQPLTGFMEAIQVLPLGSTVYVKASRPADNVVVEAKLQIEESDRAWYDRGLSELTFLSAEQIQTAESLPAAIVLGFNEGKQAFRRVIQFLGMLVTGKVEVKFLGGPIRIVRAASYEAERGISAQLLFLTMLSMNLAIINFLPIPALDGGHMFFLTAEAVRGKKLDEALEMRLTAIGVVGLLLLMAFVFANDIINY